MRFQISVSFTAEDPPRVLHTVWRPCRLLPFCAVNSPPTARRPGVLLCAYNAQDCHYDRRIIQSKVSLRSKLGNLDLDLGIHFCFLISYVDIYITYC